MVIVVLVAWAGWGGAQAQSPSPSPEGIAPDREFTSVAHGYGLKIPTSWRFEQDQSGVADVRLVRQVGQRLSGSYQVFERAFWTTPRDWYLAARTRYQAVMGRSPAIAGLEFTPLKSTTMGGAEAHSFEFRAELRTGGVICTRIVFLPRSMGKNTEVHEFILSGEPAAFEEASSEIEHLQQRGLTWIPRRG